MYKALQPATVIFYLFCLLHDLLGKRRYRIIARQQPPRQLLCRCERKLTLRLKRSFSEQLNNHVI
jgi:hypothetical protein